MKAVHIHDYGGLDVLHYEDAPRPTPGAGEVLIPLIVQCVRVTWGNILIILSH